MPSDSFGTPAKESHVMTWVELGKMFLLRFPLRCELLEVPSGCSDLEPIGGFITFFRTQRCFLSLGSLHRCLLVRIVVRVGLTFSPLRRVRVFRFLPIVVAIGMIAIRAIKHDCSLVLCRDNLHHVCLLLCQGGLRHGRLLLGWDGSRHIKLLLYRRHISL